MKYPHTLVTVAAFIVCNVAMSQEVDQQLNTARSSYTSGDLENTRFALQEALNGVNQAIGNEILTQLPATLGSMKANMAADNVSGANTGISGLYVHRAYQAEKQDATFEIIGDSPLLAGINSLLTMSAFVSSDPNQKRIKVDNYKALLTRSEDEEGKVSYSIQLPFGSSLLTFNCNGISSENEVIALVNSLPVSEIIEIAK
jgi:hypothetical protein